MIPLNHPALPRLYTEAKRRRLTISGEDGIYFVSSYTVKGLFHKIVIQPDGATCTCAATKACTHIALAAAEHSMTLWRAFTDMEADEFNRKRLEAQRGVVAQICEDRRRYAEKATERVRRTFERGRELKVAA